MRKLKKSFYSGTALDCVADFLGKVLVHQTPQGRISGVIYDVEAYPAFVDEVHHGNKKTSRTEVMWKEGGYAYIYVIYGVWYQFAIVVNKENIPDVVFIRAALPLEGIDWIRRQWNKDNLDIQKLTDSPGKLCKSFLITKQQYGADLTGDELFLEDWDIIVPREHIKTGKRIGIRSIYKGFDTPLRYFINPNLLNIPKVAWNDKIMKNSREKLLSKMLSIIKENSGIRPSELNRILDIPHTASLRNTLIKRRLIKKERKGVAVCYYPQGA